MYFTPKIMLSAVTWTKMRIAIKERLVHNHMLVYGPFTDAQVAFKLRDAFKAAQDCRHGLALCWQVKPGHSVRAGFWCNLWTSQLIATFYQGQFVDSYDPTIENTFNKTMKVKTSVSYTWYEDFLIIDWPGTRAGVWSVGGGHCWPGWVQYLPNPGDWHFELFS